MSSIATRAWVSRKRQRTLIEKRLNKRTGDYRERIHKIRNRNGKLSRKELIELLEDGEQREANQA